MTIDDLAEAVRKQLRRDAGFATFGKGTSEDVFEMAALINTFGYRDSAGVLRIDLGVVRTLYRDAVLPSAAQLRARNPTGVLDHLNTMRQMIAILARGPRDAPQQTPQRPRSIGSILRGN